MDDTQTLALQALRELLDNPDRDDWDKLIAASRGLIKAIVTGKPMTRRNVRIVAEYLREAGWRERAIGAATRALEFNRFLAEPFLTGRQSIMIGGRAPRQPPGSLQAADRLLAVRALRKLLNGATAAIGTSSSLRIGRWARRLSKISQ